MPFNLSNCKILYKNKNVEIWDQKYLLMTNKQLLSYFKLALSNLSKVSF